MFSLCFFYIFFCMLYTLFSQWEFSHGKFGRFPQGKPAATVSRCYPTITLCWVFSCFRNPSNSDTNYRIFPLRAYTQGGWVHRQRVSITFLTRKNSQFFLVFQKGFEPWSFGSRVRRSTNLATPSPPSCC